MIELLSSGPSSSHVRIVLAHGAGAPMTSPFMEQMSGLLAVRGLAVTRFEFDYMAARRKRAGAKPPPRAEQLITEYAAALAAIRAGMPAGQRLVIGGKSMGGRVASYIAAGLHAEGAVSGLVCLGYPFHPPGKPDKLRTAHLEAISCPTLIVQGERDPFGARDEVAGYPLARAIRNHWAKDGDHDLKPRKASGATHETNLAEAAGAVALFCESLDPPVRRSGGAPEPRARARRR